MMTNSQPLSLPAINALSTDDRLAWIASFFAPSTAAYYLPLLRTGRVRVWYRQIGSGYVPHAFTVQGEEQ
jgi:hypothetical protein